jgi:hypothetical protein
MLLLLLRLMVMGHNRIMLNRLAHGPWKEHRRRVLLRLWLRRHLLPRRCRALPLDPEGVVALRVWRPLVAVGYIAVDMRREHVLRVLGGLLRRVMGLVGRGTLRRGRLLARLGWVRRREARVAPQASLIKIEAVSAGARRTQGRHGACEVLSVRVDLLCWVWSKRVAESSASQTFGADPISSPQFRSSCRRVYRKGELGGFRPSGLFMGYLTRVDWEVKR